MNYINPDTFRAFELEVCHRIKQVGWHVQPVGMNAFDDLTKTYMGRSENPTRHYPDFLVSHPSGAYCYVEVKGTTIRHHHSEHFTIEKWSLYACKLRSQAETTFIVWHDLSTSTPEEVEASGALRSGRFNGVGSGDDYWLVKRSTLSLTSMTLERRLEKIRQDHAIRRARPGRRF